MKQNNIFINFTITMGVTQQKCMEIAFLINQTFITTFSLFYKENKS